MRHERHDNADVWQIDAPAPVGGLSLLHTDFPDRWELAVITADRKVVGQPISLGDDEARDTLNAWEDGAGDAWFIKKAKEAYAAACAEVDRAELAWNDAHLAALEALETLQDLRG